ncbi:NAD(P)-dependent oxidoreductase [Phycicoccus sp. M110.8]|uniref:NAD-dependent epimerase/dehydratase family protein n=1 Tax=Phycicoccus sp. M110.8 TaxID=3075433 RepID=UPI0028FD0BBB|nr:NAD(P)-dependent oxidoreductase [Phycicoccus sp. M110.8]MDU0315777.1 NAD(P)-dependent oxidoreductase [Phycicoccus sp. M110.8]
MRVWVSGSEGRLGAEVCRQLLAAGHEVVGADVAGSPSARVDLLDPGAVARSVAGCDAVVHCAGIPSPEDVDPTDLVRTNTLTTFTALEQAWTAGVRTAVLASSGAIYGTAFSPEPLAQPYVPVDEDSPLQYLDPYALTKDLLERIGQMYARRGMTVTALRFHWILSRQEVRDLVDAVPEQEGARNLWGYVDLADAARACLLALDPRPEHSGYEAVLVASDETRVVRPVEELLREHFPDTELRAPLTGTAGAFDCSRAERVLGWRPTSRWRDG